MSKLLRLDWTCQRCERVHINDSEPLRCKCGHEWDPLTAPRREVDVVISASGLDPERLRAMGRAYGEWARQFGERQR